MFCRVILSGIVLLAVNTQLLAASPPALKLDRHLQNWLDKLQHGKQPRNFTSGTFDPHLVEQEIVADYITLRRTSDLAVKESLIAAFLQKLQKQQVAHPLTPYFLQEAYELEKFQDIFQLDNLTSMFTTRSCPARRVLREVLANKEKLTQSELRATMPLIAAFQTRKFKYYAFLKILRILHKTNTHLPAELVPHLRDFPNLKIAFHSIMPRKSTAVQERIAYLLHDKKCSAAYALLRKHRMHLPRFKKFAARIEKCFRRHRRFSQLKFWYSLRNHMHKKYGFAGWAAATIRIAELHRYRDRFRKATALLHKVQQKAKKHQAHQQVDAAVFALAQVKEQQRYLTAARRLYREHITRFPNSPHHDAALKSLALLLVSDGAWEQAAHVLTKIHKRQDALSRDERKESLLGFALLWQGRAAMAKGDVDTATTAWKRLQREVFSSYHGALAHHMLEKIGGRYLPISPAANAIFEERMLYDPFDRQGQVQVARTLYLLRLGMNKAAVCEIKEQPTSGNAQLYVKALLTHAAGDWTEAIKTFSSIDRSYRELLPAGSEKILFPKRFENEIFTYASKVGLDPFLAMALIRQESVFNPRARSAADARGLMQIMPRTARYEALRLKSSYVSAGEKKRIKQAVRSSKSNLFDVSTNVLLGVHYLHRLLHKYKDTVHTLSSYNAGITPVNRWLKTFPVEDPMLFIDKIPWQETRNYVKLVLRNYFYYKRWYLHKADTQHDHLDPVVKIALRASQPT